MKRLASILAACCLITAPAEGAIHAVNSAATGANTGATWTDAYTSLPSPLVRGDTYFVAMGSYSSFSFGVADGAPVVIQRATVSNHGPATGWSDSFDGQVHWSAGIVYTVGHITMDGVTGLGTNAGFYFDLPSSSGVTDDRVQMGTGVQTLDGITFSHCHFPFYSTDQEKIALNFGTQVIAQNFTNLFCSFDGAQGSCFLFGVSNGLFYACLYTNGYSSPTHHGGLVNMQPASTSRPCYNITVANCDFWGPTGTACIEANDTGGDALSVNWLYVYGNRFHNGTCGNGIIGTTTRGGFANASIFNNTFDNCSPPWIGCGQSGSSSTVQAFLTNNVATNNLVYSMTASITDFSTQGLKHDYDAYLNCTSIPSEAHGTTGSYNPFVNSVANNFQLAAALPGISLASAFNSDPQGNLRGADGVWDIGAYEFVSVAPSVFRSHGGGRHGRGTH